MYQAKLSGWKRLAASLVLLPGLTAVGAEVLHLLGTAQAEERTASKTADSIQVEKAKSMLQQARAAYDKGDYEKAQDLAEKVKAMDVGMPFWDDSPAQVLSDVRKKTGGKLPGKIATTKEDAHDLVKKAREALDANRLDSAQDLARQAEANGRDASWGLFEETPASLLKDIQRARSKRDRSEADRLLTQARTLYAKPAGTDELRAANLDKARSLALQAAQLHGPYGMFDLGDRPQSIVKDIESARAKLKIVARKADPKVKDADPRSTAMNAKPPVKEKDPLFDPAKKISDYNPNLPDGNPKSGSNGSTLVSKPKPSSPAKTPNEMDGMVLPDDVLPPAHVAATGGILPPDDANSTRTPKAFQQPLVKDLRKAQAVAMMKQAHAYQVSGKYTESHDLLVLAQKQDARFGPEDETPEMALQSLMASAQKKIGKLCIDAHELMLRKSAAELAEAEKKLNEAEFVAAGLGLDRLAIGEHRAMMRTIKSNEAVASTFNTPPPSIQKVSYPPSNESPHSLLLPGTDPVVVVPPAHPDLMPANPVAAKQPDQGKQMLLMAHAEIRAGSLENARKIAAQVLNGPFGYQEEAQNLLRTISAEEVDLKKIAAKRSYENAVIAYQQQNYSIALGIFKQIDPSLLPPQSRSSMSQLMTRASKNVEKSSVVQVAGANPTELPSPTERGGADSLLRQEEAMKELQFQKLRSEGLQIESAATARFGKGETDAAMNDMNTFIAKVKSSNVDEAKRGMLIRPIESRIERLKVLKHQQDFLTKEAKDLKNFRTGRSQDELQTAHKKDEVGRMMKNYSRLIEEGKYQEAGKVALQAREMDPDDPATTAAMQIARTMYRKKTWEDGRANTEEWNFKTGQDNFDLGPPVGPNDPLKFNKERFEEIRKRTDISGGLNMLRPQSNKEREIESKLDSNLVSFNFKNTPLDEVVGYLQTYTGINFDIDTRALQDAGIDAKMPITSSLNKITMKSALGVVLDKANLRYVVTKDVVRVTTQKGSRGSMVRRTIPVTDLVVPVQNFYPPPIADLATTLEYGLQNNRPQLPGSAITFTPARGLNNFTGEPAGTSSNASGVPGNKLVNNSRGSGSGLNVSKTSPTGTIEETLIRLITNSIQPDTWEAMGGPGRIEYYPLGMALVINQTPDVIEEVVRLLESLRQLQDLEVAIEVRMITLAESFYERIGLDFSMNLDTHNSKALVNLANNNGLFNNLTNIKQSGGSKVVGLQAPGVPTPDLTVPIHPTSFGAAIPPFGGFPNAPGADGGLSLGLAFLSEIQVQLFLEAAQGDRRTNIMLAPKLTMFNGQSATLSVNDFQFFLTGVTVTSVNGILVFQPQNTPFPLGVTLNLQPVVTGDRRFVRLNISQRFTSIPLANATVPLFPITTIVTPVFEGGSQGQPVPFTQYIQQPTFSDINVQTTVVVPDGGTVLLGGLKSLSEGRNEFGPPVLSKIPYVSRLFRNVGYGREAQSMMLMVTPRIIINREEQEKQTGVLEGRSDEN